MKHHNIIVILGPTASGKTRLAVQTAAAIESEIISADSRQVYRGMNLGTGKDLDQYQVEGKNIPCHLIDIVDAGDDYNLNYYIKDFKKAFDEITARNKIPVLCGGTGLYIDAVLKGFAYMAVPVNDTLRNDLKLKTPDELRQLFIEMPATPFHPIADLSTIKRTIRAIEIAAWLNESRVDLSSSLNELKPLVFGLAFDREKRRAKIASRLMERLQNGLITEVTSLLNGGVTREKLIYYGLEYKFVVQYLEKEIEYDYMIEHLTIAIQQYAKRQMTYFRKMEREGLNINWIDADLKSEEQLKLVMEKI